MVAFLIVTCGYVNNNHMRGLRRFPFICLPIAICLLNIVAIRAHADDVAVSREKITQSLSAELKTLYSEASTKFQEKDFPTARQRYNELLEQAKTFKDKLGIGLGLMGLGAVNQALGNYTSARQLMSDTIPYFVEAGNLHLEGWAYAALGEIDLQLKNPTQAIIGFEKALALGRALLIQTGNSSDEEKRIIESIKGEVFRQKAMAHEQLGQFDKAVRNCLWAADDFTNLGNKEATALTLWQCANLQSFKLGKPHDALDPYNRATTLFEEIGDMASAASTRTALAWSYLDAKDRKQAQLTFTSALEMARRHSFADVVTEAKYGLARTSEESGDYRDALTHYQEALEGVRKTATKSELVTEVNILMQMGNIYRLLSYYEPAIEHLLLAAARFGEKGDLNEEAEALTRAADIFSWLGEFQAANRYYKQALIRYKSQDKTVQQIRVLASLIEVTSRSRDPSVVELTQYVQETLKVKALAEAKVTNQIAVFWQERRDRFSSETTEEDLQFARRDFALRYNKPIEPSSYHNEVALFHSRIRAGLELRKSWRVAVPTLGDDYLAAVGSLYQKIGIVLLFTTDNLQAAVGNLILSTSHLMMLPLGREMLVQVATNYFYLGDAARRQKSFVEALNYFNWAFYIADALRTPEIHWVYAGRAQTYSDMGEYENAVADFRKGLEILESVQGQGGTEDTKLNIFAGSEYVYRRFVTVLLSLYEKTKEKKYLDEAFEYTQKGKARIFVEMVQKTKVLRRDTENGEKASKGAQLERDIAKIYSQLRDGGIFDDATQGLLNQLELLRQRQREVQREDADTASSVGPKSLHTATISEVQAILPSDAVLIEYMDSEMGLTLWTITKNEARHFMLDLEDAGAISRYIQTLRSPLVGSGEIRTHVLLGEQMYRTLIEPAAEMLAGKKKLFISATGGLHYLPFETLIVPTTAKQTEPRLSHDLPYLIKNFSISYVPSASAFVGLQQLSTVPRIRPKFPLLAFGDPVYSGEVPEPATSKINVLGVSLNRLEFSGDEIRRVAGVWGVNARSDHVNLRERATIARLRRTDVTQYRILHFAVHAIVSNASTLLSQPSLVLTENRSTPNAGMLRFSEILELKQNAELVILSACETGLGELKAGEGMIGLTRAFLYSGASSAVVSLWKVEDQSTALLMEKFHGRLKRGESKEEALRQAKLEIMKTRVKLAATGTQESLAAPFFWAPFILVGDRGPINFN
jgi:CHAT domain-containing protein